MYEHGASPLSKTGVGYARCLSIYLSHFHSARENPVLCVRYLLKYPVNEVLSRSTRHICISIYQVNHKMRLEVGKSTWRKRDTFLEQFRKAQLRCDVIMAIL